MPQPHPRNLLITLACTGALLIAGCSNPTTPVPAPKTGESSPTTSPAKPLERQKLALVFLTPENMVGANFSADTLGAWLRTAMADCEEVLRNEPNPPRLLVQITLRKTGDPIYEFSGRPRLSAKLENALRASLAPLPPIHPPFCDINVRLQHVDEKAGNPHEQAAQFIPNLVSPEQKHLDQFSQVSLAAEYQQLRTWAREIALPMLGATARSVDPKFVGVISMGKLLGTTNLNQQVNVEALTFHNPNYWRGVMEMSPGNAGVTAITPLLFIANGEFQKANALLQFVRPFTDNSSLGGNLIDQFRNHQEIIEKKVNTEINRGIKFHDAGKYDDAIAVYKKILEDYPCSAWARYELFFSELFKEGPDAPVRNGAERWLAAAPEIFKRDPLYETQFTGKRGESMGEILDRLALKRLPKEHRNDPGAQLGRVAELAVRLKCYGYAAHLYWLSMTRSDLTLKETGLPEKKELTPLKTDDLIWRYLYCLEKLGCPEWKKEFKTDFSEKFKELDQKLETHRTQ